MDGLLDMAFKQLDRSAQQDPNLELDREKGGCGNFSKKLVGGSAGTVNTNWEKCLQNKKSSGNSGSTLPI